MPSLRVISVAVLIGMGAVAGAVNGVDHAGGSGDVAGRQQLRGSALPSVSGTVQGAVSGSGGGGGSAAGFDVRAENQQVAGVTSRWRIAAARGRAAGLAAYADEVSVLSGERVPIAVSGQGAVRIRAYRIGWYGGAGARQIWQGSLHALPEPADPDGWQPRGWADTTGWPEGHYLLRLDQLTPGPLTGATSAGDEPSRYLPLTVRSADARGKILVLTSPLSWQAENTALGAKARPAQVGLSAADATGSASRKASFNRPYAGEYGAGGFLAGDEGIVQLAERSGRPLAYATDYDVSGDPALVSQAAAVLVGGDSRFWTTSLRTAIGQAVAAGTNVAYFGAGTGSRQVRLAADGRSLEVVPGAPSRSVRLTGLRSSCTQAVRSAPPPAVGWTVSDAAWWGYRGTGLSTGDVLPGLVADGADRAVTTAQDNPATATQVLSFNRIVCGSARTAATGGSSGTAGTPATGGSASTSSSAATGGSTGRSAGSGDVQSSTYQVRDSGAGVFAAGVGRWTCAVVDVCVDSSGHRVALEERTRRFVVLVTENVIAGFAKLRAGRRHPARNSAVQYAGLRQS